MPALPGRLANARPMQQRVKVPAAAKCTARPTPTPPDPPPTPSPPTPTPDGVYVFAESRAAPSQVSVIQQNLVGASNTGALCANLSASGGRLRDGETTGPNSIARPMYPLCAQCSMQRPPPQRMGAARLHAPAAIVAGRAAASWLAACRSWLAGRSLNTPLLLPVVPGPHATAPSSPQCPARPPRSISMARARSSSRQTSRGPPPLPTPAAAAATA